MPGSGVGVGSGVVVVCFGSGFGVGTGSGFCVFSAQMYASSIGGTSTVEQAADSNTTNPMNSDFLIRFF